MGAIVAAVRTHRAWPVLMQIAGLVILLVLVTGLAVPPTPARRINDYANLLNDKETTELERMVRQHELMGQAQMAVALFRSLEGENLEQYSLRLANYWALGHAGVNNGVVLLAFVKERRVRLEVGRGLERILTNTTAKRITDDLVAPRLKSDKYALGVEEAITAVFSEIAAGIHAEMRRKVSEQQQVPPPPSLTGFGVPIEVIESPSARAARLASISAAVLSLIGVTIGLMTLLLRSRRHNVGLIVLPEKAVVLPGADGGKIEVGVRLVSTKAVVPYISLPFWHVSGSPLAYKKISLYDGRDVVFPAAVDREIRLSYVFDIGEWSRRTRSTFLETRDTVSGKRFRLRLRFTEAPGNVANESIALRPGIETHAGPDVS